MAASEPADRDAPRLRTPDPEGSRQAGFGRSYFGALERGEGRRKIAGAQRYFSGGRSKCAW
jgi:hypothetical protein